MRSSLSGGQLFTLVFTLPIAFALNGIILPIFHFYPPGFPLISQMLIAFFYVLLLAYGGSVLMAERSAKSIATHFRPAYLLLRGSWALLAGWGVQIITVDADDSLQRQDEFLTHRRGRQLTSAGISTAVVFVLCYKSAQLLVKRRQNPVCRICMGKRMSKERAESAAEFLATAAGLALGWAWEEVAAQSVQSGASNLH